MQSASHTPGPWHVDRDDPVMVRDADDTLIADCDNFAITDSGEIQLPDCEANARLIAAAPDGLAAAEGAYLALLRLPLGDEVRVTSQSVLAALRDFIAKATDRPIQDVQADYEERAAIAKATGEGR